MTSPDPVLHVLAGPNGAGKSTLHDKVLAPTLQLPFVNADLIAAVRWPGEAAAHAYEAAAEAAAVRERLVTARMSFITETVFSHPSKVAFVRRAADAGYLVSIHVLLVPVAQAVARVAERVADGGHGVPVDKIRQRYGRLWQQILNAVGDSYETVIYDSSGQSGQSFAPVARFRFGVLVGSADLPAWTPPELRHFLGAAERG